MFQPTIIGEMLEWIKHQPPLPPFRPCPPKEFYEQYTEGWAEPLDDATWRFWYEYARDEWEAQLRCQAIGSKLEAQPGGDSYSKERLYSVKLTMPRLRCMTALAEGRRGSSYVIGVLSSAGAVCWSGESKRFELTGFGRVLFNYWTRKTAAGRDRRIRPQGKGI